MELNETTVRPIGKHVIVRRDKPENELGGIIVPEKYKKYGWCATILRQHGENGCGLKEGDRIFFLMEYTILPFKDRTLAITDRNKIIAKLVEKDDYEQIIPINKYVLIEPDPSIGSKDGIYLPDSAIEHAFGGKILRTGSKCEHVKADQRAYYLTQTAVKCQENERFLHIMHESEIMCVTDVKGDGDG